MSKISSEVIKPCIVNVVTTIIKADQSFPALTSTLFPFEAGKRPRHNPCSNSVPFQETILEDVCVTVHHPSTEVNSLAEGHSYTIKRWVFGRYSFVMRLRLWVNFP